jgi:hypothetical protein
MRALTAKGTKVLLSRLGRLPGLAKVGLRFQIVAASQPLRFITDDSARAS